MKKQAAEQKSLSETDEFDIFGGISQDSTKVLKIKNKKHRELPKDKFNILEINKKTNHLTYKLTLENMVEDIQKAIDMIGNIVFVLFAWFVRNKKIELNLLPLSLVVGSIAKAGIMTLLIVQWAIPQFGASLAPKMVTMAKVTYSTTQLVAALFGSFLAIIIWPIVRVAVKGIK